MAWIQVGFENEDINNSRAYNNKKTHKKTNLPLSDQLLAERRISFYFI